MTSDPKEPGRRQPDLLGAEEDADIPPPPRRLATEPFDEDAEERLERMSRRGRVLPILLVVVAIGAFAAIVWWAYRTANQVDVAGELPVVQAEPGDGKVRPESEGGMDVPNQDKLIYQQLGQGEGGGEGRPEVERLLPPPEEPLELPAPPPPAATNEPVPDTADLAPPPPAQDTPDEVVADAPDDGTVVLPERDAASVTGAEDEAAEAAPPVAPAPDAAPAAPVEAQPAPAAPAAEPTPEPEEPAPQVAAAGAFRIQLASVKNEADAKSEWTRLQKTHADLLAPLQPTIQRADLGDQGIFYRIQGGPLPSREAADALCAQLKQKNQACLVVKP